MTVIHTDSKLAIHQMMNVASHNYYLGTRRKPLFIVLIPGPMHPTAVERRDHYFDFAVQIAEHSLSRRLEADRVRDEQGSQNRFLDRFEPMAVALFGQTVHDWTRERARKLIANSEYLKPHHHQVDYLFLCGNDDIA